MKLKTDAAIKHKLHLQKVLKEVVEVFNQKALKENPEMTILELSEIARLNYAFNSIISAIRGPDFPSYNNKEKMNTTAKIRYMIGITSASQLDINPAPITWAQFFQLNSALIDKSYHFYRHILDALNGLEVLLNFDFTDNKENQG